MSEFAHLPSHYLYPGTLFGAAEPYCISTLLGSCVAVCLWDRRNGGGGMTHSMLPRVLSIGEPSARHTDISIDWLVDMLDAAGCRIADLEAKLCGGAWVLGQRNSQTSIGDQNIQAALKRLAHHRIPVVGQCVGGTSGLILKQNTATGELRIRRITPWSDE
jgi:chemotaxis protein CheD